MIRRTKWIWAGPSLLSDTPNIGRSCAAVEARSTGWLSAPVTTSQRHSLKDPWKWMAWSDRPCSSTNERGLSTCWRDGVCIYITAHNWIIRQPKNSTRSLSSLVTREIMLGASFQLFVLVQARDPIFAMTLDKNMTNP